MDQQPDNSDNLLARTEARLISKGLPIPTQPTEAPKLPEDITVINKSELIKLMDDYTSQTSWARTLLAQADIILAAKTHKYKVEKANRYLQLKGTRDEATGKPLSIPTLDAMLETDERLQKLKANEIGAEAYQVYVKALLSGFEARYNLLSRELTSRTSGSDKER